MFLFDKSIDHDFMESMYENDYVYIEQLFSVTLECYDDDAFTIGEKYELSDAEGLRKAIHKMKSAFGFTGMMDLQERCQAIETKCCSASSVSAIMVEMEQLLLLINHHKMILQNEWQRLKLFNMQNP